MPFQTIPNLDVRYALINFDEDGRERTDDPEGGVFSRTVLEHIRGTQPTDVFLFSHGWKGDVPSAIDQYNRWIGAMWKRTADREAMGSPFRPVFIGLHWPSQPWGEEAIPAGAAFGTAGGSGVDALLNAAVAHFGGSDAVRQPLQTIFEAFQSDPSARVLPDSVVKAYEQLGKAIGFSAGAGPDAAPDEEGAGLDPQAAVRAERVASAGESFGLAGSFRNGILAGLRQTSFWLMKHRARTIGEQGMHKCVADFELAAANAQIHLMGHSFGCIVVSSILGGPGGKTPLPRPVSSAVLVQGALSLWGYADKIPGSDKSGYFRRILNGAVSGPIVTTQSTHDSAVGAAYPAAVGLVNEFDFGTELPRFGGIGTWGIQGTAIAEKQTMLDENGVYTFKPGRVHNLDGSQFIPGHSGIDGPQVAHVLWQAVVAARSQRT